MDNSVVINLGSNVEPNKNIQTALTILQSRFDVLNISNFQWTEAISQEPQPDYLNGAVLIRTALTCKELNCELKSVEKELGRPQTKQRNAPRSIDLDILIWNHQIVHQDYFNRSFVREYVHELIKPDALISAPDWPD